MEITINKNEAIALLKQYSPPLEDVNKMQKWGVGYYVGGFVDRWEWDESELKKLDTKTIYTLYKKLKKARHAN